MKNAIGLLLLGLLLRYGAADVSHLSHTGHNQYLPPPIQNLPVEQDYNGIDSQPHSGHNNANRGYLPPYQDQQQLHHPQDHHHDQNNQYDDQQRDNQHDHHHGNHHDQQFDQQHDHHGNHHDQQRDHHHDNQHDHHQNHQNQQQYQDPYDPSVQVSYHNDYAINQPNNQDQSHSGHAHDDHSHGHHDNHDDHVEIDQQQLEPIFPSRFPIQAYLPPTAGSQVGLSRGESHSISPVHYHQNLGPSSPAPFSLPLANPTPLSLVPSPQPFSPPHDGYQYPRPTQPTESLYPNEASTAIQEGSDGHHNTNRGYLPPSQSHDNHLSHGSPTQANHGHTGHSHHEPEEDYLPPTQSSHEHSHQQPQQDYLPPNPAVNSHSNHLNQQQGAGVSSGHSHQAPHQDYLPPNQFNNGNSHSNHLGPRQNGGVSNGNSHQEPHQDYLPPNQLNHGNVQSNHGNTHLNHLGPQQDYLSPTQSSHFSQGNPTGHRHSEHSHQEPLQDYLPPNQLSHGNAGHSHQAPQQNFQSQSYSSPASTVGSILSTQHSGHSQQEPQLGYIPPTQSNQILQQLHSGQQALQQNAHLSHLDTVITNGQSNQQNFLPSTGSTVLPKSSGGLHIVPPTQLGLLTEKPNSHLTVRGHVNVPLPIPQVGYFFIPGVVSTLPSLTQQNNAGLRPALNIPAIIAPQQPTILPTQHISSPQYTRTFLLQQKNQPVLQKSSQILSITPSIETLKNGMSPEYVLSHQAVTGRQVLFSPQQNSLQLEQSTLLQPTVPQQNLGQALLNGLGVSLVQQNNPQTLVSYPQNLQQGHGGPGYLPPINQQQPRSLNQGLGAVNQKFLQPDHLSKQGLSLQNIARSEVSDVNQISQPLGGNNFQGRGYLPPPNEHQNHHNHHPNTNVGRGYLPPEKHNQLTSLQTYMNGVHPNDRYGASQYHNPPPNAKGNPPPPVATSPPMFSKPSAIRSYAPGMAYKVSTNTPYHGFTAPTYLPPVENALPPQDNEDRTSSIGFKLNEEAKRNLAGIMPKDNTVFPLDELLDLQDIDDIDMPQLMAQLRGRIRTVQITNEHSNSVKNIKVLETADHAGVKTIKILGRSNEDPMGEHKVVRIVSKGPHPDGIVQTVKIFSDHKEVTLPTQNAYLPPPKAKETYRRVRHSQESHRSH